MQKTVCVDGWPLSIHEKLILHLGPLNESIVKTTDIYLCIKPANRFFGEDTYVNLCAVWRSFKNNLVVYQILDPIKDSLTSISLEMLTEDLPQLLQSLLVSVEQTINRVPFDELAFPKFIDDDDVDSPKSGHSTSIASNFQSSNSHLSDASNKSDDRTAFGNGSQKYAIKRREIITKHKPMQNRYTLRRMSNNKNDSDKKDIQSTSTSSSKIAAAAAAPTTTMNQPNNMPLFCLGGSFPHIDSDEDSGDDATKSSTERKSTNIIYHPFRSIL